MAPFAALRCAARRPGGRLGGSLLGLVEDGRRDLAEAMLQNTAHQIDNLGHVPNGNRGYLCSRSQPPFFHRVVARVSAMPAAEAFASYLSQTGREHAF